jgi:hypothetical protein
LDLSRIVGELTRERERLNRAIAALEGLDSLKTAVQKATASALQATPTGTRKRGGLTPAGRKRLSDLMTKRWAERRKKGKLI